MSTAPGTRERRPAHTPDGAHQNHGWHAVTDDTTGEVVLLHDPRRLTKEDRLRGRYWIDRIRRELEAVAS